MTAENDTMGNNAAQLLKSIVARVERLEEEKSEVAGQIKDVYAEAKSQGMDTKTIRAMVRRKRMDRQEREEADALLATYEAALYAGAEGLV